MTTTTTLTNPVTGESFEFLETAETTHGELLAFVLRLAPGGAVPMAHVHPIQHERFTVLDGQMRFRLGRRRVVAQAGDIVDVEPGVRHAFANDGDGDVTVRVEVRPALTMQEMLGEVVALAQAGRMTRRGLPRNVLDLADLARRHDEVAHAPLLGLRLQRVLLAPLVALARRRRPRPASPVRAAI